MHWYLRFLFAADIFTTEGSGELKAAAGAQDEKYGRSQREVAFADALKCCHSLDNSWKIWNNKMKKWNIPLIFNVKH